MMLGLVCRRRCPLCELSLLLSLGQFSASPGSWRQCSSPEARSLISGFAWFSVFVSSGGVPLSAPASCPARTSVSEGVLLMYPWREMSSRPHTPRLVQSGCRFFPFKKLFS